MDESRGPDTLFDTRVARVATVWPVANGRGFLRLLLSGLAVVTAGCAPLPTPSPSKTPSISPTIIGAGKSGPMIVIDGQHALYYGTADISNEKGFTIGAKTVGTRNYFRPTILQGQPAQTVKLSISNESATVTHNLTLENQGISIDVPPFSTRAVRVTFPTFERFEFHCRFHRGVGMIGQLQLA